jgi:murein L,D-transpeptidase YcbB/YkuD
MTMTSRLARILGVVRLLAILTVCGIGWSACAGNREGVSAALDESLAAERADSPVRAFYATRGGEPGWVNGKEPTNAAVIALGAFARAAEHGLDPEKYGASALKTRAEDLRKAGPKAPPPADLARFDVDLTTALLALGRDVAPRRGAPPIPERLASVLDEGDFISWPDDVRPSHPQYAALQKVMAGTDPSSAQGRAIRLNLERWRAMPADLGARHVLVNIPQFHLYVFENGRQVLDSRVIVGKPGDETPVFSADMTQVVMSPYWNVPESIAEGETVPAIIRNPEYLARNRIDVLRRTDSGVERVDPASVDWNNPAETSALSLRQRPGAGNALGHIKFLLPNRHSVYLHDTPTRNLFDKVGRAFSHGCVRVDRPVELAKYVLADQPEWTEEAIKKAMYSGEEKAVKLSAPLPVHIAYFTVWVDDTGTPQSLKDVYQRDK